MTLSRTASPFAVARFGRNAFLLLAGSLLGMFAAVPAAAQTAPEPVTRTVHAAYLATGEDLDGVQLAFFLDPEPGTLFGPLPLAAGKTVAGPAQALPTGATGLLTYAPDVAENTVAAHGAFVSFAPDGGVASLAELLAKDPGPLELGLLAGQPATRELTYPKLFALTAPQQQRAAVLGMLWVKAPRLALTYLGTPVTQWPDDPIMLEWRRLVCLQAKGLSGWAGEGGAADAAGSTLSALQPAAQAWLQRDRDAAEAAVYDALLERRFEGAEVPAGPRPQSLDAYDAWYQNWARVLQHTAPDFYALVRTVLRDSANELDALALSVEPDPLAGGADLIFVSPSRGALGRVPWADRVRPVVFGTPLRLVLKGGNNVPYHEALRPRLLRYRIGEADAATVLQTLQALERVGFSGRDEAGYGLARAYLARAARLGWGGYSWAAWQALMRQDRAPKWFTGLETVVRLDPDLETARQAELALAALAPRKQYSAVGGAGLCLAGVHWQRGDLDGLQRWLNGLPSLIQGSGETYDGRGDIGPANRLAWSGWQSVVAWRTGRPVPQLPDVDRRQAAVFLQDLAHDWDAQAREQWEQALQGAGWTP